MRLFNKFASAISLSLATTTTSVGQINTAPAGNLANITPLAQAVADSVIYAPDSLKKLYPFLRDVKNSPFHQFAPGVTIILNPGDNNRPGSSDPLADIINASVPANSPYRELLYKAIESEKAREQIIGKDIMSPTALIIPRLKDEKGRQLQVVLLRPLEDYVRQETPTRGFYDYMSGITKHYSAARSSNDVSFMAAVILHELAHSKDTMYAIPSAHNPKLLTSTLAGEIVADCEMHRSGSDPKIGGRLGVTQETLQEMSDARVLAMMNRYFDTHATSIVTMDHNKCSTSFTEATLKKAMDELEGFKEKVFLQIGNHFIGTAMQVLLNGSSAIPANADPEQRKIYESYAQKTNLNPRQIDITLKLNQKSDMSISILGRRFAGTDSALVYGAIKRLYAGPEQRSTLTEQQREFAKLFLEASDRRYPAIKDSPLSVQLSRTPVTDQESRKEMFDRLIEDNNKRIKPTTQTLQLGRN